MNLVAALAKEINEIHAADPETVLFVDHPSYESDCPPTIFGFTPDICLSSVAHSRRVIGEAKTCNDLRSARSYEQICAFISALKLEGGELQLMVPFLCLSDAKGIVEEICQKIDASTAIVKVKYLA